MTWNSGSENVRFATPADLQAIAEMLGDPEVGRWLWFTPISAESVDAFFSPLLSAQADLLASGDDPTSAVFAVESLEGAFLGMGGVVAQDGSPLGFEIGFQLNQQAWGRGVGTRLGLFLSAYAIYRLQAFRLEGACLVGNTGSRKILEKLGLRLEGTRPAYRLKEGVRHTELGFGSEVSEIDLEEIEEMARRVGFLDASG